MRYATTIKNIARDLFIHGFNCREIASALGCTRQTVAAWSCDEWREAKKKYQIDYLNSIPPITIVVTPQPLGAELYKEEEED